MKKQSVSVFLLVTCVFASFILGLFLGRNFFHPEVRLSVSPTSPSHNAPAAEVTAPQATEAAIIFPININTASEAELEALPGIGTELAERIVSYRSANGLYEVPEELLNVEGIGPGRLEAILNLVTTGGNPQ